MVDFYNFYTIHRTMNISRSQRESDYYILYFFIEKNFIQKNFRDKILLILLIFFLKLTKTRR